METIADPDLALLLPPFTSHLPTSFSSPRPPPTLIPLLAPITRARLSHLSFQNPTPWPSLLSWSSTSEDLIMDHITEQDFFFLSEPSGSQKSYIYRGARRLDSETMQCAVEIAPLGLVVVYLFVVNDENGEDDGWKVLDLRIAEDDTTDWYPSVSEAEEIYNAGNRADEERKSRLRSLSNALSIGGGGLEISSSSPETGHGDGNGEDDDDDYWGRYGDEDSQSSSRPQTSDEKQGPVDEDSYFARYNDVQPAMDPNVPTPRPTSPSTQYAAKNPTTSIPTPPHDGVKVSSPIPVRTSSPVVALEEKAGVGMGMDGETAIKQHVGTTVKSLYRLWRASGLDQGEFVNLMRRELECLSMMEGEGGLGSE